MILPSDIVTRHKIRDSKICSLYVHDGLSTIAIGEIVGLSHTRVQRILYKNREVLKLDKEFEKIKRVNHLKRLLNKHPENIGNKSTLDIVDQLRVESEGKNGDQTVRDTKVIIIRESRGSNADNDSERPLPRSLSIQRV